MPFRHRGEKDASSVACPAVEPGLHHRAGGAGGQCLRSDQRPARRPGRRAQHPGPPVRHPAGLPRRRAEGAPHCRRPGRGLDRPGAAAAAPRQRFRRATRPGHRRSAGRAGRRRPAPASGAGTGRAGSRCRKPGGGAGRGGHRDRSGPGHRVAHSPRADRRPGADQRDHRRGDPRQRLHVGAGHPARHDPEQRRDPEPAVGQRRGFLARRAAGRPARTGSQPYPGPGQRPAHRRLPDAVQGSQQLHRHLRHPDRDDRAGRGADRQRLGDLRLGRDLRRGELHPQEERGWRAGRHAHRHDQRWWRRILQRHLRRRLRARPLQRPVWRGAAIADAAVGIRAQHPGFDPGRPHRQFPGRTPRLAADRLVGLLHRPGPGGMRRAGRAEPGQHLLRIAPRLGLRRRPRGRGRWLLLRQRQVDRLRHDPERAPRHQRLCLAVVCLRQRQRMVRRRAGRLPQRRAVPRRELVELHGAGRKRGGLFLQRRHRPGRILAAAVLAGGNGRARPRHGRDHAGDLRCDHGLQGHVRRRLGLRGVAELVAVPGRDQLAADRGGCRQRAVPGPAAGRGRRRLPDLQRRPGAPVHAVDPRRVRQHRRALGLPAEIGNRHRGAYRQQGRPLRPARW